MKIFSYLLSLEILTIILIAFFWEEGKSHREIYQIVIDYFQNDNWVISSKYYEISKIISSISTIFMILNSLYLIFWFF
ncbi:hypothetical protein A1D29_01945 [Pasteurellaceae bacterium Orientalotternb1]|nr:hypothetical protein A1D29_01945 [Pasteurellaceae bacterium Orientalotternb1]